MPETYRKVDIQKVGQEPNEQESSEVSSEGEPQENQDTQQTSIQQPTEPRIDPNIAQLMSAVNELRESNARLQKRLEEKDKANQPPPPSDSELDAQFWKSPTKTLSTKIREELEQQLAPLRSMVESSAADTELDKVKKRLRAENPAYAEVLDAAGSYIDNVMARQNPTIENLRAVVFGIRGAAEMGALPGISFKKQAAQAAKDVGIIPSEPKEQDMSLPPHLRPSAPPAPKGGAKGKVRELTENEKRLARENGLTAEEYLQFIDIRPEEVITTKIGRKE